jgi:hypothetical protein
MIIKVPAVVARYWERSTDWMNVEIIPPVRRIDIVMVVWGVGTVAYYTLTYNSWMAGLYAAILYGVMILTGFFMRDYL